MIGGEAAEHEVFGQVIFHSLNTAKRINGAAARNDGGANGEFGAFHHGGGEKTGMKIGVHADGFELRPNGIPGTAR